MLKKRRRSYYGRRNSNLGPTLVVLLISLLAAFGGALYWDKIEDDEQDNIKELNNNPVITEEEISLPEPGDEDPLPDSSEDGETDENSDKQKDAPEEENTHSPLVPLGEEVDAAYFSDAAFVGDSLTQGLQLYDILDTHVVANKGINLGTVYEADKIRVAEGYTSVFAELERIQPKKIYLLLGANDIGWRDEAAFKVLYEDLVSALQEQHPDAVLYLQSMFPVTKTYSDKDNGINNEKLQRYNQEILAVAEEKGAYYLDIASVLMDESGALPEESSPDGMHLNAPYYKLWFNYLKTHVATEA